MKKATIGLLALGIFLAVCGTASAATNTISWSPVTTYTDGTTISGATVTYSVYWSTSSSLSSATAIGTGLAGTSKIFDPAALGMTAGSTVYFAIRTALSTGEVSAYSSAKSWTVPAVAATAATTLSGIAISGASSVNEGATSAYTATATWSDGTTTAVTPTWSVSGTTYASINSSGSLTAKSVSANQAIIVNASYTVGSVTKTASKSVTVANVAATLSGIAISGASSVNEGATSAYTATATWSDGTTTAVTPTWSVSGTTYASINSSGSLTAKSVSANQAVTVTASYTSGSVTKTATRSVTVANVDLPDPSAPGNAKISKPADIAEDAWRLSWDAATTYANGQELEAGSTVLYAVYWTRDASLASGNLVLLTTPTSATYVDFQPLAQGMAQRERVYFTLRTILGSGDQSGLSASLTWRVLNKEPIAPVRGKIGITSKKISGK